MRVVSKLIRIHSKRNLRDHLIVNGKVLKVGVIGVGNMGQNHLRILTVLKSVAVEFIYDENEKLAADVSRRFDVFATNELISSLKSVDAVFICTTATTHYDVLLRVARFVRHVFIEKPMGHTSREADNIRRCALENDLNIQVGFIERFNPAVIALKNMLSKGEKILNIDFVRTNRLSDRVKDVDVVFDLMIHDIDLALFLNGEAVTVTSYGVVQDGMIVFASANIVHRNGSQSRVLASRVTEKKVRAIQITSNNCFINCDLLRKEIIINKQSSTVHETDQPYIITSTEEVVEVKPQEALLIEVQHFVSNALGMEVPVPTANDAVRASQLCQQIKESITESVSA